MGTPIPSAAARSLPLVWVLPPSAQLASLILQMHRRHLKLLPPASSLLYALKSTTAAVSFQIGCAAVDRSKCCAAHRHWRQRGWQQLQVLGFACSLPSRSSSVLPPSLSFADFWSCRWGRPDFQRALLPRWRFNNHDFSRNLFMNFL